MLACGQEQQIWCRSLRVAADRSTRVASPCTAHRRTRRALRHDVLRERHRQVTQADVRRREDDLERATEALGGVVRHLRCFGILIDGDPESLPVTLAGDPRLLHAVAREASAVVVLLVVADLLD